jgi:hypothetical protein
MASGHHRSASTIDRRAATTSGAPSRVSSTRTRDHQRPSGRDDGSPVLSENFPSTGGDENPSGSHETQAKNSERWGERIHITSTERVVRRRPVRASLNSGSHIDLGKRKTGVESPELARRQKEDRLGKYSIRSIG